MVGQEKGTVTSTIRGRMGHRNNKPNMTVDTDAANEVTNINDDESTPVNRMKMSQYTPRTQASTPGSPTSLDATTPDNNNNSQRDTADVRSPGIEKTPHADPSTKTIPDFITQTDRYGNATAPRPPPKSEEEEEAPVDTLLDSLRMMCCCLLPDDEPEVRSEGEEGKKVVLQCDGEGSSTGTCSSSAVHPQCNGGERQEVIKLLPSICEEDRGKKCLVLDLDETLVHSSFRAVQGADFVIPVQIEDVVHFVYVSKRPGVDRFLLEMAKHYEIIVYTASLNKYADPLLDLLDPHRTIRSRLFRESCVYYEGNYVKDLSLLDRDLRHSIIVDNSPASYIFHPENAIDCSSYIDDPRDRELDQIGRFLTGVKDVKDVRGKCHLWREWPVTGSGENGLVGGGGRSVGEGSASAAAILKDCMESDEEEPLSMDKYSISDEGAGEYRDEPLTR